MWVLFEGDWNALFNLLDPPLKEVQETDLWSYSLKGSSRHAENLNILSLDSIHLNRIHNGNFQISVLFKITTASSPKCLHKTFTTFLYKSNAQKAPLFIHNWNAGLLFGLKIQFIAHSGVRFVRCPYTMTSFLSLFYSMVYIFYAVKIFLFHLTRKNAPRLVGE